MGSFPLLLLILLTEAEGLDYCLVFSLLTSNTFLPLSLHSVPCGLTHRGAEHGCSVRLRVYSEHNINGYN